MPKVLKPFLFQGAIVHPGAMVDPDETHLKALVRNGLVEVVDGEPAARPAEPAEPAPDPAAAEAPAEAVAVKRAPRPRSRKKIVGE